MFGPPVVGQELRIPIIITAHFGEAGPRNGKLFLRVRIQFVKGCELLCPHRLPFQANSISIVDDTIQNGISQGRVV